MSTFIAVQNEQFFFFTLFRVKSEQQLGETGVIKAGFVKIFRVNVYLYLTFEARKNIKNLMEMNSLKFNGHTILNSNSRYL